jgi:hypothetical protein
MNIDLLSHALTAKLIAAIAEDADEATIKAALEAFPRIITEVLAEAVKGRKASD